MFHDPGTRSLTRHKHMTQSCNLFHYYYQHNIPSPTFCDHDDDDDLSVVKVRGIFTSCCTFLGSDDVDYLLNPLTWRLDSAAEFRDLREYRQIAPSGNDRLMNGGASAKTIQWPQSTSESCTFIGKFLGKIVRLSPGISFLSMLVTFINYYYYS